MGGQRRPSKTINKHQVGGSFSTLNDVSGLGREKPAKLCKQSNVSFISDACLRAVLKRYGLHCKTTGHTADKLLASPQGNHWTEKESGIKVRAFLYSHPKQKYFLLYIQESDHLSFVVTFHNVYENYNFFAWSNEYRLDEFHFN